ncbi:MAG: SRPBCC family protein [Rhodococcus fascians]
MGRLKSVGPDFLDSASVRVRRHGVIAAPLHDVYTTVAANPSSWGRWCPGFSTESRWTSPPPHGVGSERTMRAFGSDIVEKILIWDEDRRWAFRIAESGMGAFSAFAEDWTFEAVTPTSTRVTWSMAADGPMPTPILKAWLSIQIAVMMRISTKRIEKLLAAVA